MKTSLWRTLLLSALHIIKVNTELTSYSLSNVQARNKRDRLADTGMCPCGSCVVSVGCFDKLVSNNIKHVLHDTCLELNTAMNHNTISNKEVSFNIY
jgi:hypothetical protein